MRKALVVGINDYPGTLALRACIKDATDMANTLEKNGDGSPNFSVKLFTDKPDTVSRVNLRRDIEKLFEGECDVALLYFAGHGIIKSTGGYIVTTDAQKYDEGISMDEILKLANDSKAKDRVIILDCCYSGNLGNPSISDSTHAQLRDGMTILTACRESEKATERNGSGIFTSLLIDALQGGAADVRGYITPGSLYAYVDEALGAWNQRPIFKTNVSKFISLRRIQPKIPLEILRMLTKYFKSPEDNYELNPTYEFSEKVAIAENVEIFKNLQKFESAGLVIPVDEDHMYYAAMNSKSCRLTAIGYQYWRLVFENKL